MVNYGGETKHRKEYFIMTANIIYRGAVLVLLLLLLSAASALYPADADDTMPVTTQNFSPARFALAAAEINIANPQSPGVSTTQKALFRIDSVTGEVSVLQMAVRGNNDPTIQSAVWAQISPSGTFYPFGNPDNM
jgi:hypothetical protein